jgi:hypothetical protein
MEEFIKELDEAESILELENESHITLQVGE